MPDVATAVLLRAVAAAPSGRRTTATEVRQRTKALELLHAEPLVEARYSYRFVPMESQADGVFRLAGQSLEARWLLPESGTLNAVSCCVATLGERLEAKVHALFAARKVACALALDTIGNEILFALVRRAQDRMLAAATRRGLSMAGELRAGDPGLALGTQCTVLALAGADTIGVNLSSGGVMRPLKSASMVMGVGVSLPAVRWRRCDHCPTRGRCRLAEDARSAV